MTDRGVDVAGRAHDAALARISVVDRLRFLAHVVIPTWAQGILRKRRGLAALAERWELDRKAVRFMQTLRRKYGDGPLLLRAFRWRYLLLLTGSDVKRVLDGAPRPFTPASREKRAALSHFEPHVSLITEGPQRQTRRRFNDDLLQSHAPLHSMAETFAGVVCAEAAGLLATTQNGGRLEWPAFTDAWFTAVRRIVLGDPAGGDRELTDELSRLRGAANWVLFRSISQGQRSRYFGRLNTYLDRPGPNCLAAMLAGRPARADEYPVDQVTHWLFAFDAGAITCWRALALIATHDRPKDLEAELAAWRTGESDLPYLRACFLDAVRLWPTTPVILRQSTETTSWNGATVAEGTGILIYAPYFHRDDQRRPAADRFDPRSWLGNDPAGRAPLVPFSAGPAECPGRHLVTLIGSLWLAALLGGARIEMIDGERLRRDRPLPATLDHFSLRFWATASSGS